MSNKRTQTYEEEIAELRNTHFATRLDERVATATMFNRLLDELKRCYEELDCKDKWLEELDRCPTCGQEGLWATADADAEFDDECRRCGRDKNASQ